MPSTPSYDLVRDDQDMRVPLHAEQSFFHGIKFQAKFIGWQEVPRPNSRTEIVQAMRRIRYECKVQNMKKRKVTIEISVDGVKVCLKKKKRKKKQWQCDPEIELLNHPIYRIFYVSHDSSDLKIFSYIARDGSTDTFKCSVFKSNKKSQAMRIVRTVGQAFEVCHKISVQKNSSDNNDDHSETPCDTSEPDRCSDQISNDDEPKKEPISVTPEPQITRPNHLEILSHVNYNILRKSPNLGVGSSGIIDAESADNKTQNNTSREIQQLRDQLEQQTLQTRQALGQLMLVREQLITETNARIEAQARTQQLLQQNRELLEHIASMGGYHEPDRPGLTAATIGMAPQSPLPVYFSDPDSPLRKTFGQGALGTGVGPTNNSITALNQQLSNLGSINQQLTNLSQQLNSLNQQNQNLQNYQQIPNCNISMNNKCLSGNNNNIQNAQQDLIKQQELFQLNQELLNRLQNLNFGYTNSNNNNNFNNINQNSNSSNNNNNSNNYNNSNIKNSNNNLIQNSFPFSNGTNDGSTSALLASGNNINNNNNNNINNTNLLSSPSSIGNLTPSPLSTMNRSSYSASPLDESFRLSIEKNLNNTDNLSHFIKPLSHVGTLTTLDTDGKVKVIVPVTNALTSSPSTPQLDKNNNNNNNTGDNDNQQRQQQQQQQQQQQNSPIKRTDKRVTLPSMVTLKITDESGNIMNTKKMSATPSIITRSTSEKVPNRSQIMNQVQRTAWARHTTK